MATILFRIAFWRLEDQSIAGLPLELLMYELLSRGEVEVFPSQAQNLALAKAVQECNVYEGTKPATMLRRLSDE